MPRASDHGAYRQTAAANAGSVLLEAARGRSFLFTEPVEVLRACTPADLPEFFARLDEVPRGALGGGVPGTGMRGRAVPE